MEEEGEALQLLLQEETDPKFLDIQKQILAASFATAEYNESWDEDNQQEDEIWYEAREVLQDPRVRSAADLQRLLHASSVVSMGGSASPLSNKRRLWSSTSLSESGARRRGLASPIKGPNFTASPERRSRPPRFVHRVVGEVVRSPCPEIGLFQGLSMALVDWGQSWWQRPVSPPSKTPRKRIRYGAILIILGLIALAFVIFRRRIHFKSTTETRFP